MKEQILNLLAKGLIANTSFNDIKKILGISRQHKDDELRDILNDLQLEGILYEDENNLYSKMPSNFLVEDIQETKKGLKYFELNGDQHYLPTYQLKGAQPYDKVIIEKDNKIFRVKKILRKKYPYIVCAGPSIATNSVCLLTSICQYPFLDGLHVFPIYKNAHA